MELVLIRHGESVWNRENLFTGWTDVDLSDKGRTEATEAGIALREAGYDFDLCYTSYLKRAIRTLNIVLEQMDREWLPVSKTWKLNERHYGALQGFNKSEMAQEYGEKQVKLWRRSYEVSPPSLSEDDKRNPAKAPMFREIDRKYLPLTESLKDTVTRVVPFYLEEIVPKMQEGKRILVSAHGNSLRALVKHIDGISDEEIANLNIPTGIPLIYEFAPDMSVISKRYLGDQDAISAKIKGVANQASKKE